MLAHCVFAHFWPMPREPFLGTCCLMLTLCQSFLHSPRGRWDVRAPPLNKRGHQEQGLASHSSPFLGPGDQQGRTLRSGERRCLRVPFDPFPSFLPREGAGTLGVPSPILPAGPRIQEPITASVFWKPIPLTPAPTGCLEEGLAEAACCCRVVLLCQECRLVSVLEGVRGRGEPGPASRSVPSVQESGLGPPCPGCNKSL